MRKNMKNKLIDHMPDSVIEELSLEAADEIMTEWEAVYCQLSVKEKEKISFNNFKWHVFSNDAYKSINGEKAIKAYNTHVSRKFYVIPEFNAWPKETAFICNRLPPSELATELKDFYVFPKNLAWSMAFTHEHNWLGPYFAKSKTYDTLNKKNIESIKAKVSGW